LCKEENRVLVSLDTDFSNIGAYPPEESSGIIVLRVRNQGKTHVVKVFTRVLSAIEAEPVDQRLWIVEEETIRIRGKES
jgi:predicted nuclease of predicted toxin-antitoxin system